MNKKEIILKVAKKSELPLEQCEKVINAFEKVLEEELAESKGLSKAIDKIYAILHYFKQDK